MRKLAALGWLVVPELTFSVYGQRGSIDLLAFHPRYEALLIVELKTAIVDVQELLSTFDRKRRLAIRLAAQRGWKARHVGAWVIVTDGATTRRRVRQHEGLLRAALPFDGRRMRAWLREPSESVAGLAFWSGFHPAHRKHESGPMQRVRRRGGGSR